MGYRAIVSECAALTIQVMEQEHKKHKNKKTLFSLLCLLCFLCSFLLSACRNTPMNVDPDLGPGVSLTLATERAQSIEGLTYDLSFTIPASPSDPIFGHEIIKFSLKDLTRPLALDFSPGADYIKSVSVAGRPSRYRLVKDHIIIPTAELASTDNVIAIDFRAGDAPLNRNPDFMYTLFVPARAHLAFPCFDQPNLKARFLLELNIPSDWQGVANGAETFHEAAGERVRIRFTETQPIPTYLFAFAAGKFQIETAERNGRWYRMFHRETDAKKVERNKKAVFDLHASSLDWLEKYTGIPYRFGKFDFVLIPSFQFGGMEHPGSIFYNAARSEEHTSELQSLRHLVCRL